jgi:Bacterial surface proteins containing Ig-like domains
MRALSPKCVYVLAALSVACSDRFALPTAGLTDPVRHVTAIYLNTAASSLVVGQSVQLSAVVRDADGNPISNEPVTWSSSDLRIATVSATGLVAAVALGTVDVTASSAGVTATARVAVSAAPTTPVPPDVGVVVAALPTISLPTAMPTAPASGGKVISVTAGTNLQQALDAAQPGDVVELAPGASYVGNFVLRNKGTTSNSWIVIRPALSGAQLPAEGSRMTPTIAAALSLPRVSSPNATAAFQTEAGAHHYRIVGLEVTVEPSVTTSYGTINFGLNETTLASVPHDLIVDRSYVHGSPLVSLSRCVLLNSGSSAVIDSYLSECHAEGQDAQAIAGWNGPGPFKIANNYLEGSGENVMFGGADPVVPNLVPSDIEILRNHIAKPASWKGGRWSIKNLLELKSGQRVLIQGNVFEGSWEQAQTGYAILMKSSNQSGACTWCVTQDVTFQHNIIRNVGAGFALAAAPNAVGYDAIPARRITIMNNVITGINTASFPGEGRGFLVTGNLADLTIAHNTMVSPTAAFVYAGVGTDIIPRFILRDNIAGGGSYGYLGDGYLGLGAWNNYVRDGQMVGNVIVMADPGTPYPPGNWFPKDMTAVGFVDLAGGDFHLDKTLSPFKGLASDKLDPGADVDAVQTKTQGVVIP